MRASRDHSSSLPTTRTHNSIDFLQIKNNKNYNNFPFVALKKKEKNVKSLKVKFGLQLLVLKINY